jgi:cyclin B
MAPETLFLTVSIIDRYLRKVQMSRAKLQLLGATALLLASKYEEIYPFAVSELVFLCDGTYSKEDFIAFETHVLQALGYKITVPSEHSFLVRYLKAGHANKKMIQLSRYILDGTLQSYKLMEYLPSQLAAASVMISRSCIGRNKWSSTLAAYTKYSKEDILPIAHSILSEKAAKNVELISVNQKYMSKNYGAVAETVLPTMI